MGVSLESELEYPSRRPPEHWVILLTSLAGVLALVVLGFFANPDPRGVGTHEQFGLPPCRAMQWFDVPCPGCGVTTSMSLASQGRFVDSFANQPFGLLFALFLPVFAIYTTRRHLRGGVLSFANSELRLTNWAGWAALIVAAAWVWKIWSHKHGG